jgi:hypothetical protein
MEPNFVYSYDALEKLERNPYEIEEKINQSIFNEIYKNIKMDDINLVIYEVNNDSQYKPFLRFLFEKNLNGELEFIKMNSVLFLLNQKPFLEYMIDYLTNVVKMNGINNELIYEFKGMNIIDSKTYLWIDITNTKLEINDVHSSSPLWFTLVDEIMNSKHICGINFDPKITHFFTENPEFLYIQDEKKEPIEIPMVAYVGRNEKKLEFTYVFGVTRCETEAAIMGPYYYFSDYDTAIKQIKDENYSGKIGLVRLAIFLGKILINIDDSSDSEDWDQIYDSVYLGKLDNNYVIKTLDQQYPLSFHYINKNSNSII